MPLHAVMSARETVVRCTGVLRGMEIILFYEIDLMRIADTGA